MKHNYLKHNLWTVSRDIYLFIFIYSPLSKRTSDSLQGEIL